MRPLKVARDLTDEEIKQARERCREQGRRALMNGQTCLAAFWTATLGELEAVRKRRQMRASS